MTNTQSRALAVVFSFIVNSIQLYITKYRQFFNNIHIMDPRWKHSFTAIIAGPTGSGKTVFTFNMIENAEETTRENYILLWGISTNIQ
jgi:Tfp pilus assembly pilus retraction ATPase PilT